MEQFTYHGRELELFKHAVNWKRYWTSMIRPFVSGRVLDVGAGLGATATYLNNCHVTAWHFLEPYERLLRQNQQQRIGENRLASESFQAGTIADLPSDKIFDTILYIDVLEHIDNDRLELERASRHLRRGGHLIVVSPAIPALYSEFDKSVRHFRRYTRQSLGGITPARLDLIELRYIDSLGMLTSSANRFLLKKDVPNLGQILFWDRFLIPLSRVVDPALSYKFGKTICGIWARTT
ncbi:MAG: class I SAM-dependent methyltransferase [Desulfobacterales bacterium]|nr:class I SAM-dependent methyltransferase [Desulfobacterales bacterium]